MNEKYSFIKITDIILKIAWYLQWAILLVIFTFTILILTDTDIVDIEKISGFSVEFAKIDLGEVELDGKSQHDVFLSHGSGRLYITDYKQFIIMFRMLGAFFETLFLMYIILMLQKMFVDLKLGKFFIKSNGIIIKKVAYAIIAMTLFLSFYNFIINSYIFRHLTVENIIFKKDIDFDFKTLLFGLMLFIIAKSFIRGTAIKSEHDLTI